jgi:ribonuclease BN (tRNA processing enzyme)
MQITILGSGTRAQRLDRSATCISVVSDSTTALIDTGPGSLRQLLQAGITINEIDLLCYSHLHIDHTADFVPLLFASQYPPEKRINDLSILAAPEFREHYDRLTHAYGKWIIPESYALCWLQVDDQPQSVGPFSITTAPVEHTPQSIAFRLQDTSGKSMVYSGDTDYCTNIVQLARDCDLLILECSFPEGRYCQGHLTPEQAGKIAAESGCNHVVLTHFYPDCDPQESCRVAAQYFDGIITAAHDLIKFSL